MQENRREFIKRSCGLCASVVGISILAPALQGCSTLTRLEPVLVQGVLSIPVSSFIEKQQVVIIENSTLDYEIAVVKSINNTYRSFELRCTHQETSLIATNSGFHCNLHGSSFSLTGKVNNPPASSNLKEYKTTVNSGIIEIML